MSEPFLAGKLREAGLQKKPACIQAFLTSLTQGDR